MINIGEIIAQEEGRLNFIHGGSSGRVSRIGESDYCVKILLGGNKSALGRTQNYKDLEHEDYISRKAYEAGVSVPEPMGVIGIRHPDSGEFVPGFVMEYIPAVENPNLWQIAKLRANHWRELRKARKAGVIIGDSYSKFYGHNLIFSAKNKKWYLIDFGHWKEDKK